MPALASSDAAPARDAPAHAYQRRALSCFTPTAASRWPARASCCVALLATGLAGPAGAGTGDTLGSELMRLTNLDRTALGKSALAEDPTLVAFAQGKAWTCPGTTMVLAGRSSDMARRDYFSHSVKSCAEARAGRPTARST